MSDRTHKNIPVETIFFYHNVLRYLSNWLVSNIKKAQLSDNAVKNNIGFYIETIPALQQLWDVRLFISTYGKIKQYDLDGF